MLKQRLKAALLLILISTASLACVTLPKVRAALAAQPEPNGSPLSCSGIQAVLRRAQASFSAVAAGVACTYLGKDAQLRSVVLPAQSYCSALDHELLTRQI